MVPVIDIAGFDGDRALFERLDAACREHGIFYLEGHGVDAGLQRDIDEAARRFFALSADQKARVAQPAADRIRGYIGYGKAALAYSHGDASPPDIKESFNVGPLSPPVDGGGIDPVLIAAHFAANPWPDAPAGFRDVWQRYYRAMEALSGRLFALFAGALGLPGEFFVGSADRHVSVLGAMHYPVPAQSPLAGQMRAGAHRDFGSFTVLQLDHAPGGLQAWSEAGGWADLPARDGALVVNLGELMARWTNDRWIAPLHRVVNAPPGDAPGRLTIGYFQHPNLDAEVACLPGCVDAGEAPRYDPVTAGAFLHRQFTSQQDVAEESAKSRMEP